MGTGLTLKARKGVSSLRANLEATTYMSCQNASRYDSKTQVFDTTAEQRNKFLKEIHRLLVISILLWPDFPSHHHGERHSLSRE